MNIIRALSNVLLGLILGVTAQSADLQLVVWQEGRTLPVVGIENNRIVAQEGDRRIPLKHDSRYELKGDLRAAAGEIFWTPEYGVRVTSELLKNAPEGTAAVGFVSLRHMTELDGERMPSDFLQRWPGGAPQGGIMVLAWIVDGRISQLAVDKIPSTKTTRSFVADHEFYLKPAETNGQGALLLWIDGRIVAPKPQFKDSRAHQALGAMLLGDLAPLRSALAAGMKPAVKGAEGETLLHFAAGAGQDSAVDFLIRQGVGINLMDNRRSTALHWAALKGRKEVVARLLAEKIQVSVPDGAGDSPLHLAIWAGHADVADALLDHKADVNGVNSDLQTPYSMAIDRGYAAVARRILAGGGKGQSDREGLQRVLLTQAGKGNVDMVRLLIEQKASADFEQAGHRPLAEGAISGKVAMIPVLLSGGARVDDANADGVTALMFAAANGSVEYARALVEAGAQVGLRDKTGRNALHYAAARNLPELTESFLGRGADLSARDQEQRSPLDMALLGGAKAAARILDQAGAVVDLRSPQAAILMEAALKMDLAGVVGRALASGWSAHSRFHDAWPALLVAETCQASNCATLLRQAGAQLQADAPVVVRASEIDQPPRLAAVAVPVDPRDPDTTFPAALVEIDVVIDQHGQVRFPVVQSAPDWLIAEAALRAVDRWRFTPVTKQGRPVATRMRLPVEFVASVDAAVSYKIADVLPISLQRTAPVYPAELAKSNQQGVVNIAFTVDTNGRVKDARVISTSAPVFNQPALAAIQKWLFKPGELDGKPTPIRVRQEIVFNLQ